MLNVPAAQQLRFAKAKPAKPKAPPPKRDAGLVKDQNRRTGKLPWIPTFSSAFRLIILVRFFSAMYGDIADCDEVFNYWEPLHYLLEGTGFQTWEYSPEFAIRSYAYLLLHFPSVALAKHFLPWDKRPSFFVLRLTFAFVSSLVETVFYRSVVKHLNARLGRYLFFSLLFSSAFYTSATSFLPSTFAMWGVMLATSFSLAPVDGGLARIVGATMGIAAASIVGWPFAALLGVPLVLEQLFMRGTEHVEKGTSAAWAARRARNFFVALLAGGSLLIPVVLLDSHAYQKLTVVPLNIVSYNIFSPPGVGPDLYGTSPSSFYFLNGLLSFNVLFPLSLLALPLLALSSIFDPKRLGDLRERKADESNPWLVVAMRLVGWPLWLAVLTAQAHKEERFLFPAYGLVLLSSSTSLFLIRGLTESAFLKITKSPYRLTQSGLFSIFTRVVLVSTALISLARISALHEYYHAPLRVYHHLQTTELPRLVLKSFPTLYPTTIDPFSNQTTFNQQIENYGRSIALEPLAELNGGNGLRLCIGKEWYRFPSSFLVPKEMEVRWIESEFKGIMPKNWIKEVGQGKSGLFGLNTDLVPSGMNERNEQETDRYVPVETCDYLIDLDYPARHRSAVVPAVLEPRYAVQEEDWTRVYCLPFLDNENSSRMGRTVRVPLVGWNKGIAGMEMQWGDYCLLRNKHKYDK